MANLKQTSKPIATIIALTLAACSGRAALLPAQQLTAPARVDAAPAPCKGQTTSTEYAISKPGKLKSRNTHACIPAFAGFGGSFHYPAATPAVPATTTSSTMNYNKMLPALSKGKPIFYLQIATTAATEFASTYKASGGLESKAIKPGKTYDVYGQAKLGGVAGIMITFTPCRATAIKAKHGGAIAKLGTVLEGQNVTSSANIVIEVYPKGHVKATC
jgi:hypothetical protein